MVKVALFTTSWFREAGREGRREGGKRYKPASINKQQSVWMRTDTPEAVWVLTVESC